MKEDIIKKSITEWLKSSTGYQYVDNITDLSNVCLDERFDFEVLCKYIVMDLTPPHALVQRWELTKREYLRLNKMIEKLVEELKKDKSNGSYYYAWQANIAVAMQDAYSDAEDKTDIHKISNDGAKRFLDLLIRD